MADAAISDGGRANSNATAKFVMYATFVQDLGMPSFTTSPLGTTADQTSCHEVLVNLGQTTPTGFARFERLIEVVGLDQADREPGRERWRFYRDRGYQVTTHDIAALEAKR